MCRRKVWGDESERLLTENGNFRYRPKPAAGRYWKRTFAANTEIAEAAIRDAKSAFRVERPVTDLLRPLATLW